MIIQKSAQNVNSNAGDTICDGVERAEPIVSTDFTDFTDDVSYRVSSKQSDGVTLDSG